jgi:CRP/FNR family cyclic AMP-dependent transcriptional regulator
MLGGDVADSAPNLSNIELLTFLPFDKLYQLETEVEFRSFSTGKKILAQGNGGTAVCFLVTGSVRALIYTDSGRVVGFASILENSYFGELAAIDGLPRSVTVIAATDCFIQLLENYPKISNLVLKKLAAIIRNGNEKIEQLSLLGGEQRVCMELLRMAVPSPSDERLLVINPMPSQEHLAQNLGLSRRTVVRTLKKLLADKSIYRSSKIIFIHSPEVLKEIVLSQ